MAELKQWVAEVDARVGELAAQPAFGIRPVTPKERAQLLARGFPGMLALWTSGTSMAGLLALPDVPSARWPGVIEARGQALTIASDATTLLPRFLMNQKLSNNPGGAERVGAAWSASGDAVEALHAALGGTLNALQAIGAAFREPARRETFKFRGAKTAEFQAAHSALAQQIDKSDAMHTYADWLDKAINGDKAPLADPEALGAWKRQALAWTSRLILTRRRGYPIATSLLIDLVEAFAGLDTGVPVAPTWALRAGAASGETAIISVADKLDPNDLAQDEVVAGLVRALQDQGDNYDGYAHFEATAAREEGGQASRAWGALNSAAWWTARRTGEAPPAVVDGARLLTERHGWDEVRWTVDRASGSAP